MTAKTRQYAVITGVVAVLCLISFLLLYYGRQHKVIIDNRSVELADGQSFRSLPGALVAINRPLPQEGEEEAAAAVPAEAPAMPLLTVKFRPAPDESTLKAADMLPRERIMVQTVGPSLKLAVAVRNKDDEVEKTIETTIHLGLKRDAMVRLVKLARGLDGVVEDFPNDARPKEAEPDEAPAAAGEAPAQP